MIDRLLKFWLQLHRLHIIHVLRYGNIVELISSGLLIPSGQARVLVVLLWIFPVQELATNILTSAMRNTICDGVHCCWFKGSDVAAPAITSFVHCSSIFGPLANVWPQAWTSSHMLGGVHFFVCWLLSSVPFDSSVMYGESQSKREVTMIESAFY